MNFVDPFFFISGYLMYAMIKPKFAKLGAGWTQIPQIVVYKYLRYGRGFPRRSYERKTGDGVKIRNVRER